MDTGTSFERDTRNETHHSGWAVPLLLFVLILGGLGAVAAVGARTGHAPQGAQHFDDDVGRSGRRW